MDDPTQQPRMAKVVLDHIISDSCCIGVLFNWILIESLFYLLMMKGSSVDEVTMIHAILVRIQYFHNYSKTIISCIAIMIKYVTTVIARYNSDSRDVRGESLLPRS